jgi:hypothetical protein
MDRASLVLCLREQHSLGHPKLRASCIILTISVLIDINIVGLSKTFPITILYGTHSFLLCELLT